jgi:hypothetical protein
MTQLGENIAVLVSTMEKKQKCEFVPDKVEWKANLNGSSTTLANLMGNKPANTSKAAELSSSCWPSQAHHLIPHLTLVDHAVADWLKAGDLIYADTKYNVDHKKNGLWLPYASSLDDWEKSAPAARRALMFKVMELAGLQLHQGKHSASKTFGVGLAPYKSRVAQYLSKIEENARSHFTQKPACGDCSEKKEKGKGAPRNNTVVFVDKASSLLKKDIKQKTIFVSRIAAEFVQAGGL